MTAAQLLLPCLAPPAVSTLAANNISNNQALQRNKCECMRSPTAHTIPLTTPLTQITYMGHTPSHSPLAGAR